MLTAVRHTVYTGGILSFVTQPTGTDPNILLFWGLIVSSALLAANVVLDVGVLRRTALTRRA
jgi:hypothetical protein